ncbi:MAG: hypothetical protein PHO63_02905, partial [Bacilli bacterium]|nr:hypothetical protein [Bacilli bacterium]
MKRLGIFLITLIILLGVGGCFQKEQANINKKNETENQVVEDKKTDQIIESNKSNNKEVIVEEIKTIDEVTAIYDMPVANKMTEEATINYFQSVENKVNEYINKENFDKVKDKVTDLFILSVDFVFYGSEINGVKFNDLTEATKIQILKIVERLDNKIESKQPGYKIIIKD